MRRVLFKALGLYIFCGLSLCALITAPQAYSAPFKLPQAVRAGLNTWINPPASGVELSAKDFPSGHIMGHVIGQFAGPDKTAHVCAIYAIKAEPGLYTSLKKAPPQYFHQVKGFWLAGSPYHGEAEGEHAVQWLYSDPSYTGYDIKCKNFGARINFRVSPKSQGQDLYLVVLSKKPGVQISLQLKFPGDPDAEVAEYGSSPPWCPESHGVAWGYVMTRIPLVIPAPGPDMPPVAGDDAGCENGCKGRLALKRVEVGSALPSTQPALPDGGCPAGFSRIQTAKDEKQCLGCDPGKSLAVIGSNNGRKQAACLQCPKGYQTIMMKREAGKDETGAAWSKDTYACLECEKGYQLVFPIQRRGKHPDGARFVEREAMCWRCPEGKAIKEKAETKQLPDGSTLQSKVYSCE